MKIAIYSAREDEKEFFENYHDKSIEFLMIDSDPTIETVGLAKGCDCVSIVQKTVIDKTMFDKFKEYGIKFLSSRTIGMEHVDVDYASEIGIGVSNVSYTPKSVAEYTVMMMLCAMRNVKTLLLRSAGQDFSLFKGTRGRLISDCTVGIVGTGKIGSEVAKMLMGFGCKIIASDIVENPALAGIVEYVTFDYLLENADIISIHTPSTPQSYHLFNSETIGKMKKSSILVNTARGEIIDSMALIEALENEKISGAALDVVEGDRLIYYRDKKSEQLRNREMAILSSMPNVFMMPHMAFFSDHAVRDMVEMSIESCISFMK